MKPILRYTETLHSGAFHIQCYEITVPLRILLWRYCDDLFDNWQTWLRSLIK